MASILLPLAAEESVGARVGGGARLPSPDSPRDAYFAALHEQFFPQVQVFLQAQPLPQVQLSALTQPQDLFAQRHSFWFAIGLSWFRGRSCPPFTTKDAATAPALHRAIVDETEEMDRSAPLRWR